MPADSRKRSIHFGQAVRELRTKEGISQLVLAERADLSLTYVSELERGLSSPSLDTIVQVARAFGASGSDLLRKAGL